MDFNIFEYGAYVATGIVGWFVNILWTSQSKLREEFNEMERELPLAYVRRDEFKDVIKEMKESFKEAIHPVLAKLDRMEEERKEDARENDRLFVRKE
jgi:hypothetical protein